MPSTAATIGCGQARIAFTRSPRHPREGEEASHVVMALHFHQRTDDIVHIAAGAEIAPCSGEHDALDALGIDEVAKGVAQLGVQF